MMTNRQHWFLALIATAAVGFSTVSVRGGDAGLVGYWTFDDKLQSEIVPVLDSHLEAIDGRAIVVRANPKGEQTLLQQPQKAADASGQGNHASIRGSLVVPGVRGNAIEFNGRDSYVEAPDSPSLRIGGAVTIEMWVRPDDFEHGSLIAKDFKFAGSSWCQMYFCGSHRYLSVAVNNDGGPTVNSRTLFEPGHWYHVAMSYDGKSRTRIYVNGALDREDTTTYQGPIPVGGESLKLGKRPDGQFFQGALDEVRLSARELTAEEIQSRYRATKPDQEPQRRLPLAEKSGAASADAGAAPPRAAEVLGEDETRRKLKATWTEIELRLPSKAVNFALQSDGATYSASTETEGPITLGTEPDREARMSTIRARWQVKGPDPYGPIRHQYPDRLTVRFAKPHEIDCVILRTFGEHVLGRNKEGIRDYQVQCCTANGNLLTVAAVRNNTKEYLIHRFPPVVASEVRLVVTAANRYKDGKTCDQEIAWASKDLSRLQDLEIYRLGSAGFGAQTKSRVVAIEKSAAGRVAIFNDKVPMPEGVAASPDHLAQVLRQAGFGVTFLDYDLLANTAVLNRDNFDLFIHPYGCSFPLGTTLYSFLEAGGHLVTLGGQAFTNAIVRSPSGKLVATGYDPGIITTPGTMVKIDWYVPLREQLGMFAGPKQRFVLASSVKAVGGQHVIDPCLRIDNCPLEGYPATGLVGQNVPIEEEQRYVHEGKELQYILDARRGTRTMGRMHPLAGDSDFYMFNKPCARWLPLLEARDRYDRPRGAAGAMILNHDGLYRGSTWTCFGATNRDLFAADNAAMTKALTDVARFAVRGVFLHGLRAGYDCYRQGEKAEVRVFAANFGPADRKARVSFVFRPLKDGPAAFRQDRDVLIPRGRSTLVEAAWAPPQFDLDFYRVRCTLTLDDQPGDEMESGFVVWNEASMQKKSAFRVDYQDNYFRDGTRPLFIAGTRTNDLHRAGQVGHDPLSHERQYQAMQDFGMTVVSPVFFQMYLPGFAWGKPLPELVPEVMLRQMDALVQLSQRHKLIFAPCLFFENKYDCLTKEGTELSAKIAKLLGDRYCRVPGLVFYIWDDGVSFDGTRADRFLEFSRRCTEAFASNPAGRRYLTLAEWYDSQNMGTRRILDHLTIGHHRFRTCGEMVPARIADLRAAGKSQGCGEFDLWASGYGNDSDHRFYLDYPHIYFGLGYSWILNWEWQDEDSTIFPWGIVYPSDRIPKGPAYTYRNLSWFFRSFRPKYVQPDLMFVLANAYWQKNKPPREQQDSLPPNDAAPAEIDGQLLAHLGTIMGQGHVNLGVVDEADLPKMAATTKALIYPAAMCPDEKTYAWLRKFVRGGGHLYVTGDISYAPDERQRHPERLKELAGVEPTTPLTEVKVPTVLGQAGRETAIRPVAAYGDWKLPYQGRVGLSLRAAGAETLATDADGKPVVVRHKPGKGQVVFNADLSANAPGALIDAFLRDANVQRVPTEPDSPEKVRVFRVPMEDGTVYGVTSPAGAQNVTLTALSQPVTLRITRSPMVMAGVDTRGRLTACESDGLVMVGDRKVIEATASVMAFALDGKPIEESEAVVLLPQPEVSADFICRLGKSIDFTEIGDVQGGSWHTREQSSVVHAPDGLKFHIDANQSLSVVLLTRRGDRNRHVERLTRFLLGYLE